MKFININNVLVNLEQIAYIIIDDKAKGYAVIAHFNNDEPLRFEGEEAARLWKALDEGGWRDEP